MNEAETRAAHIDPALKAAGWGVVEGSRILRVSLPRKSSQGRGGVGSWHWIPLKNPAGGAFSLLHTKYMGWNQQYSNDFYCAHAWWGALPWQFS
ncbi:MAG: hypothetical protein M9910_10200 [Kiritimatiellae bacterium]|nr:hypothetical protein [Kiritimatiellia bacterium]